MSKKVVLAYSGGLDTSFCVKYLTIDKGYEVHCVIVNTGGFSAEELEIIEKKAYSMGAKSFAAVDAIHEFYDECIKYLVFGNILRGNVYPLSVSAERMFQALAVIRYATKIGAQAVAHGSTGAGNDQVRFDLVFNTLGDNLEIITPIRDLRLQTDKSFC